MRPHRIKMVGIVLVVTGIALSSACSVLLFSSDTVFPVNVPISLNIGQFRTREFKVTISALYRIEIEVQKKIPFDTLNCLLGMADSSTTGAWVECPDRPSVLKMSWTLTLEGQTVAEGSSVGYQGGWWGNDSIAREIGHFQSERGRRYVLEMNILVDGSALAPGNPRLKVVLDRDSYDIYILSSAIFFLVSVASILIGIILLIVSYRKTRRARLSLANT